MKELNINEVSPVSGGLVLDAAIGGIGAVMGTAIGGIVDVSCAAVGLSLVKAITCIGQGVNLIIDNALILKV